MGHDKGTATVLQALLGLNTLTHATVGHMRVGVNSRVQLMATRRKPTARNGRLLRQQQALLEHMTRPMALPAAAPSCPGQSAQYWSVAPTWGSPKRGTAGNIWCPRGSVTGWSPGYGVHFRPGQCRKLRRPAQGQRSCEHWTSSWTPGWPHPRRRVSVQICALLTPPQCSRD